MGQEGSPARAPTSPLATLAHVREPGEVEGQGVGRVSWRGAGPAGSPAPIQIGEVRWRGARLGDRTAALIPPSPNKGRRGGR
jgi:hypothetical protein